MDAAITFKPGDLVRARHREWVVLPEPRDDLLKLRPLGGAEDDATLIYLPLEPEVPVPATFDLPNPDAPGSQQAALLLRDALRLKLRAGAGPFRSFGNLNVEPRAYQLVPLLMALKLDTIRLLVADDVGIGKTIEAGLIARELLDRGEIERLSVICPPHLCEQWQRELSEKFAIDAEVVRTGTATRLERGLRPDESVFEVHPYTVVSLDYIKSDRRRSDFLRACPEFVIVDEAHACVRSNTNTRHQRYQLLKGLADSEPRRHMVFLTATPHSGDDTAFHNLLGLLETKFTALADAPEGEMRRRLREELALHFVQRRRGDIAEWKDEAGFPVRESREATYRLTGEWGGLFDDVLDYARTMVDRTAEGTRLQQRMSWWAALALLRFLKPGGRVARASNPSPGNGGRHGGCAGRTPRPEGRRNRDGRDGRRLTRPHRERSRRHRRGRGCRGPAPAHRPGGFVARSEERSQAHGADRRGRPARARRFPARRLLPLHRHRALCRPRTEASVGCRKYPCRRGHRGAHFRSTRRAGRGARRTRRED